MTISLEIPEQFEQHFNTDRFRDSLERIRVDIECAGSYHTLSGLYEIELIKMLEGCLIKAEPETQNEKLKCCQNCKHCNEIISYKALGGKEISKICSDGNYVCNKWEIKEE